MTIEEYKKRLLAIFSEIEKEHGRIKCVEMEHDNEITDHLGRVVADSTICTIKF